MIPQPKNTPKVVPGLRATRVSGSSAVNIGSLTSQLRSLTAPGTSTLKSGQSQSATTLLRNTRSGRGMLVPIPTLAASTPYTITHNLGRYAQGLTMLNNANDNSAYTGPLAMYTGSGAIRTLTQQTIISSITVQNAIVEVT